MLSDANLAMPGYTRVNLSFARCCSFFRPSAFCAINESFFFSTPSPIEVIGILPEGGLPDRKTSNGLERSEICEQSKLM
jgi:hypothetical protein